MSLASDLGDSCHHEGVVSGIPSNATNTETTSALPHTTERSDGPKDSDGSPKTSRAIIEEIITLRTEALWNALNQAFIKALQSDQQLQKAIPGLTTIECVEEPPGIRFPDGMAFHDLLRGQPKGGFAHARAVALLMANQIINDHLIPALVRVQPSLTREQLLGYLKTAWPGSRGPKSKTLFPPGLVTACHDAILRENPSYDCRAACQLLADRLGVTARTIQSLRAQVRRKN